MSHYPYGYGFQGQQPPQQYPYQPYGAYPAPGYGAQPPQQQPPPATPDYYNATQSAYDYNANNIPGLGTPFTAPQFPVPFGRQWNQARYGTSATPAAYPAHNPSTSVPVPPAPPSQPKPQARLPAPQEPQSKSQNGPDPTRPQEKAQLKQEQLKEPSRQPPKEAESQDEGEISDGEFDDLYEDVYDQPVVPPKVKNTSPLSSEERAASSTDQAANFYDTEMDDVSVSNGHPQAAPDKASGGEALKEQDPKRTERERSGSYSPYLSPREIEQGEPKPEGRTEESSGPTQVQKNSTGNDSTAVSSAASSPGVPEQAISTSQSQATNDTIDQTSPDTTATSLRVNRSLPEAQNEAKKAILRLLPHGVKYQTYLDEGFDENVVKDLFTQLNLAPVATDSASSGKPSEIPEQKAQDQDSKSSEASQADAMAKKQEERKDKIARLLAEKKAKAAAEASAGPKAPSATTSTGASTPSTTPATKTLTQAQKTLLLQQKMEALRKAREAQTQQAGQKPNLPNAPKNDAAPSSMPPMPAPTTTAQTSSVSNPTTQASLPSQLSTPQDQPRQLATQQIAGLGSPAPPGLPNKPINQRKRPVAADFVDYPTKVVKRPFLPSRQASSLVISVSDDEDEDEDDDIDMEVDSTTEDSPAPAQQTFNLPRRGPSVRDYPPLTNVGPPRNISSPAPGTPGGKTATVDLKAMEKAIADYKRKIQEAEARAKAKPSPGSSTPQSPGLGAATPTEQATRPVAQRVVSTSDVDDKNGPSAQLLQEAEAAKTAKTAKVRISSPPDGHSRVERRVRTGSAQSPRLSTKLQDKIAELKRMEEERRRLQAEIDAELAQQQHIEEEVIDEDTEEAAPDSDGDHVSETMPTDKPATPSDESSQDDLEQTLHDGPLQSAPMDLDSMSENSDSEMEPPTPAVLAPAQAAAHERESSPASTQDPSGQLPASQPAEVLAAIATSAPTEGRAVAVADSNASDGYEPSDAAGNDHSMDDSPPFSPAPAEHVGDADSTSGGSQDTAPPLTMPSQVSTTTKPNDDPTIEVHAESSAHPSARTADVSREGAHESLQAPQTSFTDYESPLRYYHAFRFHPRYSESVAGGLRSLTYSNRIDPKREICPDELEGQDCPRGNACQFQHFSHMIAPDDKIILELGSSDDLAGDQKKTFNNGLRELVASFQKSKIRDFKTIAQGIVEFRRRFLGDSSRVLRLEGVSI